MYVILVYDIKLDDNKGQRALNNIYKICKKYLTHIQNSTFEGELSEVQIKKLNYELKKFIRKDKDSVIIFKSREKRWLEKEFWGIVEDKTTNFL
ncbi:MAG: CRISPR-associated protein Cas2 [Fusobacteriaceae bacterium]|jgi:CRISPR-associated protein Cas2|nr:CRISPR-associated protein Cas2 [Fusobacteriaceae bacterium]